MTFALTVSQLLANIATVLALVGVIVAYRQFRAGAAAQQRTTAVTAWTEYLKLALAHPKLARPELQLTGAGVGSEEFSQYRWFVAIMMFASEQVLEAHPDDTAWADVVQAQLRYHRGFLHTSYFDPTVYSPPLSTIAAAVKSEALPATAAV